MKFGNWKKLGGGFLHTFIVVLILLAQFHQCAAGHSHGSDAPCVPCPSEPGKSSGITSPEHDHHNHCELKSCSIHEVFELKVAPIFGWDFVIPASSATLVFSQSVGRTQELFVWITGNFPNAPPQEFPARAPPTRLA